MALPPGIATRVRFYSHSDDDDFNPVVIGGLMMHNIKCPAGRDKGINVGSVVGCLFGRSVGLWCQKS